MRKGMARQLLVSASALRQWSPRRQFGAMKAFIQFADSFERAYASEDWSLVEARFSDDIIWAVTGVEPPVGGAFVGPAAALAAVTHSCNSFDKRFDRRMPRATEGPIPIPGGVFFRWDVIYRREGVPDFRLYGEEWDFFRDGKLEFHRERLINAPELLEHIERYNDALLPAR